MLWVEKYRPATFEEIVGNRDIINEIESSVKEGEMPHLMLLGPAGIGKTTAANVIANWKYGSTSDSSFKELNASDERGIDVIRNKVKKFAGRKSLSGNHKIVFLDEADSLTRDAQQSLRRVMEEYHDSCRFILTGNYGGKLIDPLKSRCSVHEFNPISQPECLKALERISGSEELDVDHEVLERLTQVYHGDLRRQIGKLQSLASQGQIEPDDIDAGEQYAKLFKLIAGDTPNFEAASKIADKQTLRRLFNYIMAKDKIPGRVKADISITFAKYMWRIDRSADERIQTRALVAELTKTLQEHRK